MKTLKTITKVGGYGRKFHAADFNPKTGEINLYCDTLKAHENYFAAISEIIEPTEENVTCNKCKKKLEHN